MNTKIKFNCYIYVINITSLEVLLKNIKSEKTLKIKERLEYCFNHGDSGEGQDKN